MRLIDIEAFYKFCDESFKIGHEVYPEYYDDYLDSNMFTVTAIPIDWIHDYLDNTFLPESHFWVIQKMIKEWDKEHEKDI